MDNVGDFRTKRLAVSERGVDVLGYRAVEMGLFSGV